MGLHGAMNWRVVEREEGKRFLVFEYRVNGYAAMGMETLAPAVDGVIGEQHANLVAVLAAD